MTTAAAAVISILVAFVVTWLVIRIAPRIGLIDTPNPRSSHLTPTPRGGGLGVIVGTAAGIGALAVLGMPLGGRLSFLLFGALAIAALGAIDDLRPIPAILRLVLQLAVGIAVSISLGGVPRLPLPPPLDLPTGLLAVPLGALWLAAVTNFYNFMDGIDGLAAGEAVVASIGIVIAGWSNDVRWFSIVFAASALGFLALNRPPAKIFLGDIGSTSIGFTLAGLALVAGPAQRGSAVLAVGVSLALFLLDPFETLVRLMLQGHRIGSPHRLHAYQILTRVYHRHAVVAGALLIAGLALSLAGALAFRFPNVGWPVLVFALAVYSAERYLAGRTGGTRVSAPG